MTKFIECHIKILSPVHLGCDEVYDPLSFRLDEEKKTLVVFYSLTFLFQLRKERLKDFSTICKKGTPSSILEIYKFIRRESPEGRRVSVTEGFVEHYNKTLSLPTADQKKIQQELNNFIIQRTAFLPTSNRPYIPGSALKGSLRTAYLNFLCTDKKDEQLKNRNGKELEKFLMGGTFSTDPFRFVKVSDFLPVGDAKTKIVYAVNEKKRISEFVPRGPHQILEVIEPGAVFRGTITIDKTDPALGVKNVVETKVLLESLKVFFGEELERESQELARIKREHSVKPLKNEDVPMRIGRHSGAESVTIARVRSILIRGVKGQTHNAKGATTFWLAADARTAKQSKSLSPFGWVSLHMTDEETKRSFEKTELELQRQKAVDETPQPRLTAPKQAEPSRLTPETEEWPDAYIEWNPGRKEITARYGQKKASTNDLDLVTEGLRDRLKKKKALKALVKVTHEAGDYYKILSVESASGKG